jgi:hypothetical protein
LKINHEAHPPTSKHGHDSADTKAPLTSGDERFQWNDLVVDRNSHLHFHFEEELGQDAHAIEPASRNCPSGLCNSRPTAITAQKSASRKFNKTLQIDKDTSGQLTEDEEEWTLEITKKIVDNETLYFRILRYEVRCFLNVAFFVDINVTYSPYTMMSSPTC